MLPMRSPHVTVQPETGQAVVAIVPRERCRPDVVLQKKVHTTGKGVGLVVSVLQQMIGVARATIGLSSVSTLKDRLPACSVSERGSRAEKQ